MIPWRDTNKVLFHKPVDTSKMQMEVSSQEARTRVSVYGEAATLMSITKTSYLNGHRSYDCTANKMERKFNMANQQPTPGGIF